MDSIRKMRRIDELLEEFPGLDCGSCGAPTCRALAEDIVRGQAEKTDCVHILRDHIHQLSQNYKLHAREDILGIEDPNTGINVLLHYVDTLTKEIARLDPKNNAHMRASEQKEEAADNDRK
jgi:Na+-translocating ferredoxin:NAD+ oxidoreductase RNF subunit RnfB